jgi:hypothetical protein
VAVREQSLSAGHSAFWRRQEGEHSAEAGRKIDAVDDNLSTGSQFSLRFFATWSAKKNAAKPLT